MKQFLVSIMETDRRQSWVPVGTFSARSAAGAIQQFARTLRHIPNCCAVKADQVF